MRHQGKEARGGCEEKTASLRLRNDVERQRAKREIGESMTLATTAVLFWGKTTQNRSSATLK